MARIIKITRSSSTGWWAWTAGDCSGWANSKREARRQAREALSSGNCDCEITPPNGGIIVNNNSSNEGNSTIYFPDTNGKMKEYPLDEINENTAMWLLGSCNYIEEDSTPEERVIALLKVWDIYQGDIVLSDILVNHNLQAEEFYILASKEWNYIFINIDNDENISWTFSDTDPDPDFGNE